VPADAVKAGAILFVAALVQVTVLNRLEILGGGPDLLLLALVGVSLLRGSVFGAVGGFGAAGYWIGRYGETTGRDRVHAPFVSVAVVTVLASFGELVLHFMIGDHVSARLVLLDALFPSILLNLVLTAPVYALCRRLLRPPEVAELATEVRLLG
jgi:cell shape-determining protein MreD